MDLNKWKKAISVGMSASLLASLFTVIAASTALAGVTVTSAGNVPRGGTSATTASFVFTESSAACIPDAAAQFTVTIAPAAPGAGTVTFSGTPVVSAPGSLGVAVDVTGSVITVDIDASDTANVESISISGLSIKASTTATLGAITATYADVVGANLSCWQAGGTASGTIATGIGPGATSVIVNVATTGCLFVPSAGAPGTLDFVQNAESVDITAVSALGVPAAGQQTLTIAATASLHDAATGVSQSTACAPTGVLASPGTVVDSLIYNSPAQPTVIPGENNQDAGDLSVTERTAGFLSAGTTLTFTIATAGVTFSHAPNGVITSGALTGAVGVLSPDLKSVTFTINTASVAAATLTVSNIDYDVAASVPIGTSVSVGLVLSGSKVVTPTSRSNAVVGRVVVGIGATPTVFIGENNQASGLITLTESGPGFLTDGTGPNNVVSLCLATFETFTLAPWAIVTGGDLRLREGAVASPDNIVLGTAYVNGEGQSCAYWTVWTASTTASTIEIRATDPAAPGAPLASGPTSGPRLSVGSLLEPGTTQAGIAFGDFADLVTDAEAAPESDFDSLVVFAVRAFRSGVNVVALSQPTIPRGSTGSAAGNVTNTETLQGQFKPGEEICFEILPRTNQPTIQDTFFLQAIQNQRPVLTTNVASGLAVSDVTASGLDTYCFFVTQQAFGPTLGVITISNMNYITTADAINGPVLLNVFQDNGPGVDFEAVVSNAKIGTAVAGTAATRLGVTQVGAFTISTKLPKIGKYVTYRFDFGVGAAGQTFKVWGATKTGNDWSAFTVITARVANASGVVYYHIRQNAATWRSYRAEWAGGGVFTPARQSRWIP